MATSVLPSIFQHAPVIRQANGLLFISSRFASSAFFSLGAGLFLPATPTLICLRAPHANKETKPR
ncbi:MAG: hypothetical protein PW792_08580 [Acidobacteriaceae bacterium]|nr:hypothetical protein [Acidobacteriaceae bacterium]